MKKYIPQEFWSVYDSTGKKIADCGWERDAAWLAERRKGTYRKTNHELPGPVVDVTPPKQLPTTEIVVNMDGGVGGSWEEKEVEYEHINDDPHDGWWLYPEHQDTKEPENIHQLMYEMATKSGATTLQLDPIGGSENFQGGSENVHR